MTDPADRQMEPDQEARGIFTRDPCDGCDGTCGDVCPVLEARRLNVDREIARRADLALADANDQANGAFGLLAVAERERDRLRAEVEALKRDPSGSLHSDAAEIRRLRAEVERLRAALTEIGTRATFERNPDGVDQARRIAATLPQLYDIDYMEPGGEPVAADMVAIVETVLRDANTQGAVNALARLFDLELVTPSGLPRTPRWNARTPSTRPTMADLPSFTEWADAAGVSWPSRVRLLNEAIGLIAQERDDMKAMLIARGETEESISAELDLIEAGREVPDDDSDPFGLGLDGPTVGYCSKCGEARIEHYTCRDGGETVADASPRTDQPNTEDK